MPIQKVFECIIEVACLLMFSEDILIHSCGAYIPRIMRRCHNRKSRPSLEAKLGKTQSATSSAASNLQAAAECRAAGCVFACIIVPLVHDVNKLWEGCGLLCYYPQLRLLLQNLPMSGA